MRAIGWYDCNYLYCNNRELEDESSDESETEMDTDAQTVTSKGKHDLMMKSEVSMNRDSQYNPNTWHTLQCITLYNQTHYNTLFLRL